MLDGLVGLIVQHARLLMVLHVDAGHHLQGSLNTNIPFALVAQYAFRCLLVERSRKHMRTVLVKI